MRRRLAHALFALTVLAAAALVGLVAPAPAGAELPDTVAVTDLTHCSGGKPFVAIRLANSDPANPVSLSRAWAYNGAALEEIVPFELTTGMLLGGYPGPGETFRIAVFDEEGTLSYDTGFVDPCATTSPAIWLDTECSDTEMTMRLEVRNRPAGQATYVRTLWGNNISAHVVNADPQVFELVADPMRPARMWVTVGDSTVFDSGVRHMDAEGSCDEPVPPVEDIATFALTSECTATGAALLLSVDGNGHELAYGWSFGEDKPYVAGTRSFGPGDTLPQAAEVGDHVRLSVVDPWGRVVFSAGPLGVTTEGTCSADAVEAVAPVLAFKCVAGQPVAVVGARNDGNVDIHPRVAWYAEGHEDEGPDEDFYAGLAPAETRVVDLPVPPGSAVEVHTNLGSDYDEGLSATGTAPSHCPQPAPAPTPDPEPSVETPAVDGGSEAPAPVQGVEAPAVAEVAPGIADAPFVEVAAGALPRTGSGTATLLALALVLIASGAVAIRCAHRT